MRVSPDVSTFFFSLFQHVSCIFSTLATVICHLIDKILSSVSSSLLEGLCCGLFFF